jgi:hypothetical protein
MEKGTRRFIVKINIWNIFSKDLRVKLANIYELKEEGGRE